MEMLERHYRDVQDVEFTIEQGRLYILQTRSAKRTAAAALKAAVDMAREELISRDEAVRRIEPASLDHVLHPMVDPAATVDVAGVGLPASPGAAVGAVVFDPDVAAERGAHEPVILVRFDTTPDDIHGLAAAKGILTAHGGMASHAAVVARGMGKPCVAGCDALQIDEERGRLHDRRSRGPRGRAADRRRLDGTGHRRCRAARRAGRERRSRDDPRAGPTAPAGSAFARTPTRPSTPGAPASSAPKASGSAAPSTCSSARSGSRSSRR